MAIGKTNSSGCRADKEGPQSLRPRSSTPVKQEARNRRRLLRAFYCHLHASIQESHISHGLRLPLGVHHDPVPAMQGNRGMVGVPNAAPNVNAGVTPHDAPTPALRLWVAGQDI